MVIGLVFWANSTDTELVICVGVIALIGLSLLLMACLIAIKKFRRQNRNELLHSFAAANGWTCPAEVGMNDFPDHGRYELLKDGHSKRVTFLMHKPIEGGQILVFDYSFTTGDGTGPFNHLDQTVIALYSPRLRLPFFALYRETTASRIGEVFGYRDIDFSTHPYFSRRFKLRGEDEANIRKVFHPQLLIQLEQMPDIRIDGGASYVFAYTFGEKAAPENLNRFINEHMRFLLPFAAMVDTKIKR